jgi:hypothetical protein
LYSGEVALVSSFSTLINYKRSYLIRMKTHTNNTRLDEIKQLHREYAYELGRLLAYYKQKAPRTWQVWVAENLPFNAVIANHYIQTYYAHKTEEEE